MADHASSLLPWPLLDVLFVGSPRLPLSFPPPLPWALGDLPKESPVTFTSPSAVPLSHFGTEVTNLISGEEGTVPSLVS